VIWIGVLTVGAAACGTAPASPVLLSQTQESAVPTATLQAVVRPTPTPVFEVVTVVGEHELRQPFDVAVDEAGNLFVTDTGRVHKFGPDGTILAQFGDEGEEALQLAGGLALDAAGNVYVADALAHAIKKFNAQGDYLGRFGKHGQDDGDLDNPMDIALDAQGNLYISEKGNRRVQVLDAQGRFLRKFGQEGRGRLRDPRSITFDGQGNVYVVDLAEAAVHKYTAGGEYVLTFEPGRGGDTFLLLRSIAVDDRGRAFVIDGRNARILQYDTEGKYKRIFGGGGRDVGQFANPEGITVDADGRIYIADRDNHRVQILRMLD